jgi:hypothetical protein
MIQPTDAILKAITNLEKSNPPSFKILIDWLHASWTGHLMISSITEKDPQRGWMQGRCQELRDLIQFIMTAEEQLKAQNVAVAEGETSTANKFD